MLFSSFIISFAIIFIYYYHLLYLLYSTYKSFILVTLFFLVDGYRILDFEQKRHTICVFIICFLFDSILSLLFIYIVYYFPSINNFYLFTFKNIIEHVILLIFTIKAIKKRFMPFYYQYKIEKLKRINYEIYKTKLSVYIRVFIFSFLYGISFILLSFIELKYDLDLDIEIFIYNYFLNIFLEVIFFAIYGTIFFPFKIPNLYYINLHYDRLLLVDLKNIQNPISILTKKILKKKAKEKMPIIFVNPFYNDENATKKSYIGLVENK